MSCSGAPPLPGVLLEPIYPGGGEFSPALADNLRAAAWLLARSRADLWHFVFAPNPRTSGVGRVLKGLRRLPVVQTVASPPRSFVGSHRLLFGDVIVAQSRWTRARLLEDFERANHGPLRAPRIEVIPPPVPQLRTRTADEQASIRRKLDVSNAAPLFVYPGDLETSRGASTVARAAGEIAREIPGAMVIFAYRPKSPKAHDIARELARKLGPAHCRFTSSLPDVLGLVQAAQAVLFPVDDLWGKVDLPIVLLESMALGVPVIALDRGPLAELGGVLRVAEPDPEMLARAAIELHRNPELARRVRAEQLAFVKDVVEASRVARAYEELYLELL